MNNVELGGKAVITRVNKLSSESPFTPQQQIVMDEYAKNIYKYIETSKVSHAYLKED